jgi:signal transduction histidine kinase
MTRRRGARKASLRRKIVLLVSLITCFLTSVFMVAYFFAARADTIARARITASESLARLQRGLDIPLWNLDTDTCGQIANGELNDPSITAVIIRDDASGMLFGVARNAEAYLPETRIEVNQGNAPGLMASSPISMAYPVSHGGRRIGEVEVLADPRPALGALLSSVLVATALAFLVGVAIAASLYFLMDRIVTVRLLALGKVLERFSAAEVEARSPEPAGDEIGRLAASFNDMADTISERTVELESRTEEVRLLLARVEGEREEERTRVARELHDELGQGVTGLGMALYLLERRLGERSAQADEMIADMRSLLSELTEGMRRIIADLRPSVLDRVGLPEALARLASESGERSGIRVEFSCPEPEAIDLADAGRTAAYRVAKEALTNAVIHSRSQVVRISLAAEDGRAVLEVRDEGRGFAPTPSKKGDIRSFGIIGMRERCRALGGDFLVTSAPGAGTAVRASFPMPERSANARADS